MSITINSRVAIQARIAEWRRQYRQSDFGPRNPIFVGNQWPLDHVSWLLRAA